MLSVYAHEGDFNYEIDELQVQFQGETVFVHGTSNIVYGMEQGELVWEYDDIRIVWVCDMDGNDLNLTTKEENEIANIIRKDHDKNGHIDDLVAEGHSEHVYWNRRR